MSARVLIAITTSSSAALPAPLADAVDGRFSTCRAPPSRPASDWRPPCQIVVAMDREEDRLVGVRHARAHHLEQRLVLVRRGVADSVGDVDRRRAGLDRGPPRRAAEVGSRARCAVPSSADHSTSSTEVPGAGHLRRSPLQHCSGRLLELVFHVHGRGGDEGVGCAGASRGARPRRPVDVPKAARERPATTRVLHPRGDERHRSKSPLRRWGSGLDDVDAHLVQEIGDLELLLQRHRGAGHCSPSRKVVSNTMTRFFGRVVMGQLLTAAGRRSRVALGPEFRLGRWSTSPEHPDPKDPAGVRGWLRETRQGRPPGRRGRERRKMRAVDTE